jgi:CheY-like chemotaxis protein
VRIPVEDGAVRRPATASPNPIRGRRALVVEDNDDARESLRLLLEALGHEVVEASEGGRGVELAIGQHPEVVLIDLGLPGVDGYEVARAIRAHPAGRQATLIAVTGYGQAEDRRRAKEAGFDAHLLKPVSQTALSSLIAAARAVG